ncbi:hypothetical protein H8959_012537 [Pygathrix nigripes]
MGGGVSPNPIFLEIWMPAIRLWEEQRRSRKTAFNLERAPAAILRRHLFRAGRLSWGPQRFSPAAAENGQQVDSGPDTGRREFGIEIWKKALDWKRTRWSRSRWRGQKPGAGEGVGERQSADGLYPRTRRSRLRARWWPSQLVRKCRRVPGAPLGPGSLAVSLRFPSCTVGTRTVTLPSQDRPGLSRGSTP